MDSEEQLWDENDFCETYEKTWEISHDEVHYGWLAPGENELHLLKDMAKEGVNVLDVGCGLGQNLISLAKQGVNGFGLDISSCMLDKAKVNISKYNLEHKITLEQGDMRDFVCFQNIEFDIILSIYSMEYLSGVQEFRALLDRLYKMLKPNGVLIICFSHPSQEYRYPELLNDSVPSNVGGYKTFNYSFRDATNALFKAGFTIDRIIEQITKNPSQISYKESLSYPYHFNDDCNPCVERYDAFSNGSPHTVIYKARKPNDPNRDVPKQRNLNVGNRELWGYKRKVTKEVFINYLGLSFKTQFLAPRDNILGVVDVISFKVNKNDLTNGTVEIELNNNDETVRVAENSVLGLIYKKLKEFDLDAVYKTYYVPSDDVALQNRVSIDSIVGLEDQVMTKFETRKIGLLTFVNDEEPAQGELPLDLSMAKTGDLIKLIYVVFMGDKNIDDNQLDIFS